MPNTETISQEEYQELSEQLYYFQLQESFSSALYLHFLNQDEDHSISISMPWQTAVRSVTCAPVGVLGTFMPHEKMIDIQILSPKKHQPNLYSVDKDWLVCTTTEYIHLFLVKVRLEHAGSCIDLRINAEDCMYGIFKDANLVAIQQDIEYHQSQLALQTHGLLTMQQSKNQHISEN